MYSPKALARLNAGQLAAPPLEARIAALEAAIRAAAEDLEADCAARCAAFRPYARHAPECQVSIAERLREALEGKG